MFWDFFGGYGVTRNQSPHGFANLNLNLAYSEGLAAVLLEHGKQYEFHRYDGAGHGFFYYDRPMYRIEQALDGWKKVFAFFEKHLKK